MSTPHIQANKNQIAKTVIMPGDPLRAQYIAEKYLTNPNLVNSVRGILAYTGEYNGKVITVMASGMGIPSMGIYSYELYKFYDVENIIRIGTAGSYVPEIDIFDLVLVESAYSESTFALIQGGEKESVLYPNKYLSEKILSTAENLNILIKSARVHSTDVFYSQDGLLNINEIVNEHQCKCVEMEAFSLFHIAKQLNRKAACMLTISNSFVTNNFVTPQDRESALNPMIEVVLKSI